MSRATSEPSGTHGLNRSNPPVGNATTRTPKVDLHSEIGASDITRPVSNVEIKEAVHKLRRTL